MEKIKVFIVDDQKLILEAWEVLLSTQDNIEVMKTVSNAKEAIEFALVYRPDIVLLDINLGEDSGFDVCTEITQKLPKTKVIGLSFNSSVSIVKKFIASGASGYLTKNIHHEELFLAINRVHEGMNYICQEMQEKFINAQVFNEEKMSKELSSREIEIVKCISTGMTSKEIADHLYVSQRTVETHRYNILKKMDFQNVAQLIVWATRSGILE